MGMDHHASATNFWYLVLYVSMCGSVEYFNKLGIIPLISVSLKTLSFFT